MANVLSKSGITNTNTIQAWHVSQSVDAFTAASAFDVTISGSLTMSGSTNLSGSTSITGSLNVSGTVNMRGFSNATASWATNVVNNPTKIDGDLLPLNGGSYTTYPLKFVVGSLEFPISATSVAAPAFPAFVGKQLGTDVFVTVGISSSYSTSSLAYFPLVSSIGASGELTFTMKTANASATTPFFYHAIYKA